MLKGIGIGVLVVFAMTLFVLINSQAARLARHDSDWIGKAAPELATGDWINSPPHTLKELHGKVVLLEFWTFGCYNCRNTIPSLTSWHKQYSGKNFVVIGIHTPEFDSEKKLENVKKHIERLGITYPVVTDNQYATWNRYNQQYWPVLYLVDKKGIIRHVQIGEGNYAETEHRIVSLLAEE